jgi:hypothetical protein
MAWHLLSVIAVAIPGTESKEWIRTRENIGASFALKQLKNPIPKK